jgi:hypothetical protein
MSDELVKKEPTRSSRVVEEVVAVGEWYWVRSSGDEKEWLGCVVHVGSNYAELAGPRDEHCTYSVRILLTEFWEECRREPGAEGVIASKIAEQREVIAEAVRSLAALTSRLCLGEQSEDSDTRALAAYDGSSMGDYKSSLLRAKEDDVPAIQKRVEEAASKMRAWMTAGALPLQAQERKISKALSKVDDRIAGVEIYSGLVEELALVRGGSPAAEDEPVHLFQRRLYMDEECLANYQAGGMTFENLAQFEEWLLRPPNLDRIMPRPRCAVALRVRREKKEDDGVLDSFVRVLFGGRDKDMRTYLYLRNGERVYRLDTAVDFGEKLFPDSERSVLQRGKVYAVMFGGRVDRLATEGEYLDLLGREAEQRRRYEEAPDDEKWRHAGWYDRSNDWVLWDDTSVYYDDVSEHVRRVMSEHNRLVLLLQGVLDRSEAFRPHPPCRLWVADDFCRMIRLVFDDDRALVPGDRPDFLAYQARVNGRFRRGSLAVGQEDFWLRREAGRHNDSMERQYGHEKAFYMYRKRYRPEHDPGPGVVAPVAGISRRGCVFEWRRPRRRRRYSWEAVDEGEVLVCERVVVPTSQLLCVEGYRPGDYHMFYDDPRTRADYLRWAPLLLRAEEWYSKNSG